MMRKAVCLAALALTLHGQAIIPAKAGLITFADQASVDDRPVEMPSGRFFAMNDNSVLRTGEGRAEVLLGACSAMWVDERSSVRMVSSALSDVRLELLQGSVIVATGQTLKGTGLTMVLETSTAPLDPKGAYRFDREPARVKALAGKTTVQSAGQPVLVSAGRLLLLDSDRAVGRFDKKITDAFEDWSVGRAELMAQQSGQRKVRPPDADQPLLTTHGPSGPRGLDQVPAAQPRRASEQVPQPAPAPPPLGCGVTPW